MGNYTIFLMFENPRRSRQARNFTENDTKILDLKSSSEQIIFRKLPLGAPDSRDDFTNSSIVIIMMIKIMMFQDRICSHMFELTLVVFVSRVACSCPVRVGASLLAVLFPS